MREKNRDWVRGGCMLGEHARDVVPPELEAEGTDWRGGNGVGNASEFDVQSAGGEIGGAGGGWDEGL